MSEEQGLGIFCGLCDKYYPDIQTVEEHTVHTLSKVHWIEVRKSIENEALSAQLATIAAAVRELDGIDANEQGEWFPDRGRTAEFVYRAEVLQVIDEAGKNG